MLFGKKGDDDIPVSSQNSLGGRTITTDAVIVSNVLCCRFKIF